MGPITVLIADKSLLVRLGVSGILNQVKYPLDSKTFAEPSKLFNHLLKEKKGLLIISRSFLSECDKKVIEQIRNSRYGLKTIFINDCSSAGMNFLNSQEVIEPDDSERVIRSKIEKCLRKLSGKPDNERLPEEISRREEEVLKLVALGLTNKEIADRLFISMHTVITHRKNITAKLGIKTIAGLTVYALLNKLITTEELK